MAEAPAARVGRPRRYDDSTEYSLLLDSGMRVLERNGYSDLSVADIVDEAGVSRRAFYRHFVSKDALVQALFRRETDVNAARLTAATELAETGRDAVERWLDEFLALFTNPRRASRVRILNSDVVRRTVGFDIEARRIDDLFSASLEAAIRRGVDEGAVASGDPGRDARVILAVAGHVGQEALAKRVPQRDAVDVVKLFCWPALGLDKPA